MQNKLPRGVAWCVVRKMVKNVANIRYPSRYPIGISWVIVERVYNVERPETASGPRLETSLMRCTIDAFYKTNLDTSEKQMRIVKYGRQT